MSRKKNQEGENGIQVADKPQETKAERFRRIGNKRLQKALKAVRVLRNLANRAQYEYTEDQAAVVVNQLIEAVNSVKTAFVRQTSEDNAPLL